VSGIDLLPERQIRESQTTRVTISPCATAEGGGPLIGQLVVVVAALARVLQQLLDPRADLLTGVFGRLV
jgi:hypothetical protein